MTDTNAPDAGGGDAPDARNEDATGPRLPPETRIGRVALRAGDVDRLAEFYRDVVGLAVLDRTDDRAVLGAGDEPLLVVEGAPDLPERPADAAGLFHLALLVPDRGALGDALRRIRDRWELTGASDHLVSEALYLRDPEGNGVEVYRDRPREEWPRDGGGEGRGDGDGEGDGASASDEAGVKMDTLPLDLDALAADAASASEGDVPPSLPVGTRVGHVHLEVTDLARSRAFYGDALGLDLMDEFGNEALFLSAGGYHHHVGLNVWQGRSAAAGDHHGLRWFEVVLPDAGAVREARERLADAGFAVSALDGDDVLAADPDRIAVRLVAA